jgi:hypothetical protein
MVRVIAADLVLRYGQLAEKGERSVAVWQTLLADIQRAYVTGQRDLITMQRQLIESARGMAKQPFLDAQADADEVFVALQELAGLRMQVEARIGALEAVVD